MKFINAKIALGVMAAGMALSTFTGCKKDFLDLRPYTALTPEEALATEADLRIAMNGVYNSLRGVDGHGRTVPVLGDLMADNIYQHPQNSNRYTQYNLYAVAVNDGNALGMWTNQYVVINRANNIINSALTGTAGINQIKGEAKAVRALAYFTLVKFFARPYTENPDALGVPLVLAYDINAQPTRNTVREVYTQIIKDCQEAFAEMTTFKNSSEMHRWAARALEAKVRLYMGDMPGALAAANDVINNSAFTVVPAAGYRNYWSAASFRTDRVETLFEVSMDPVGNLGFDAIGYIFNQNGYGDFVISDPVFATLTDTDVRKTLYQQSVAGQTRHPAVFVTKFLNIVTDRDNTKILRLSDMYLIAAEASAATNPTNAQNFLNFILTRRDPVATPYASTGQQLVNDILTERQKEFLCEGDRFHDLNRLKLTVNRSANFPASARTIEFTNFRRILPIPEVEGNANPNIRPQQNPGYQ